MKKEKTTVFEILKRVYYLSTKRTTGLCENKKAEHCLKMRWIPLWWAHLGSNQGPTDYESATLTN